MTRGYVPERDEAGNENWDVMRIDLDLEVPRTTLDEAPERQGSTPRRYARYPGLAGRDVVDFLLRNGVDIGAHDAQVAGRVAEHLDLATVMTLLSWVRRAAEAPRGP